MTRSPSAPRRGRYADHGLGPPSWRAGCPHPSTSHGLARRGGGQHRRAFTLLELLLATSLAAVLLLALWSMLTMHVRLFTESPQRIEQTQIVRALFEQLRSDLYSALLPNPPDNKARPSAEPPRNTATTSTGIASTPATTSSSQGQLLAPLGSLPAARFLGTADSLQIEVLQPPNPLEPVYFDEPVEGTAREHGRREGFAAIRDLELKSVAYFFESAGSMRSRALETPTGLRRCELPWGSGDRSIDEPGCENWVLPQVAAAAFRYFDGGRWQEDWDSLERGGFPLAVEIRLRFGELADSAAEAKSASTEKNDLKGLDRGGGREPAGSRGDQRFTAESASGRRGDDEWAGGHRLVVALPKTLDSASRTSATRTPPGPRIESQQPNGPATSPGRSLFP